MSRADNVGSCPQPAGHVPRYFYRFAAPEYESVKKAVVTK
jgi:hypothetical protein